MAQTYNLTQGKVMPLVLKFFFPMFLTNMLQQIYTVADTAIVGKGIGDDALAAVGNMSSLTFLVIGFSTGLGNGFAVSISKYFGAKNKSALRKSIAAAIKLSLFVVIILTFLSVLLLRPILLLMRTDEKILRDSLAYGYVLFGGLAATIAYNLCASILRALGDSKTPFIAIIISSLLNITLNYLLICIMHTGVEGAAFATILSQIISAAVCYLKLRKIEIIRLHSEDFKASSEMSAELIQNGLPMALMNSITAVGCMVVQYFVNSLGVAYTSAYAVCSKYINLFMQPACTAGFTMSAFTGQNYGAKKYSRIKEGLRVCLSIAFISYVLLGSVMVFFPEFLAGLMLNEKESITLAAEFLPICGLMLFGVDFLFIYRNGVQGMGHPLIPMISGIVEMVMRILVIAYCIPLLGFKATAYAEVTAWLGALLLNLAAFYFYIHRHSLTDQTGKPVSYNKERIANHG